ncbi:MAG: CoA transferase [Nevskia sp.]|nr:CoA transferase [Nevskia sp.]
MNILEGIRVLDFTQYLSGPTVTRLMAEMGAEIIKVEPAPGGDPSRLLPLVVDGRSGYFVQQNRGKQSLCMDLRKPEAVAIARELAAKADVVVENFGPGVMEKRGLAYDDLKRLNPGLVMASISAYGRNSLLSHKTGYDWVAQAFAGVMHMTGNADGPPLPAGISLADVSSGVHAFSAIGYALFHRSRTGQGQWLDISMVDSVFHMLEIPIQAASLGKGAYVPMRSGPHHPLVSPFGIFKVPGGHIVILALQSQWEGLCDAMQRPDLKRDPRFETGTLRAQNQRELTPVIEAWLAGFKDQDSALELLERHRVPSAPVLSPADAIDHPYFRDRGTVRTIVDPVLGQFSIPGFPLRFSAQPDLPDLTAPLLGQHNAAVLSGVLGYSEARIGALAQAGILASADR